jgi:hypothetical protein
MRRKIHAGFWLENLKGRERPECLSVNERIILKRTFKGIRWQGEDWLHLALDRNNGRAVVNKSKNLQDQ